MADTFGFGTDTTGFSDTVRTNIQKAVIATLRAGLIALPKGTVAPAQIVARNGDNFTLRVSAYPDLDGEAATTLTEGVPPTPLKLAIDTLDYTVAQQGAFTKVTDLADFQSPHNLSAIAADKVHRLAADTIDRLARTALLAHAADLTDTGLNLSTEVILYAKSVLRSRDVAPVPGVGYYCLTHPRALIGLENETDLNGYVDVTAQAKAGDLTAGAVSQYRGVTFLTSTKFADSVGDGTGTYPAIFMGAQSVAFGDIDTLDYFMTKGPDSANPLAQFGTYGFKAMALGGKVLAMSEKTDGSAVTEAPVDRVFRADVAAPSFAFQS